jgi:ribose 5-phosphate isomerase B
MLISNNMEINTEKIRIGIAADHGGFDLKEFLKKELQVGFNVIDFGNVRLENEDDYPDFVIPMARSVANAEIFRGIAVCGSGVGACVAVNKLTGVRACLITDTFSAHQGVEDDNMNIICLGGRVSGTSIALEIVRTFLDAEFTGAERHKRRLAKVEKLESER